MMAKEKSKGGEWVERLDYVEMQIKRTEDSLKRALRHQRAHWMVKPLEENLRRLKYEKEYLYQWMMKEKIY